MTNERLAELKKEAEDALQDGLNRGTVSYPELLELVELAGVALKAREKTRTRVADLRKAKKSADGGKAPQKPRGRPKKPLQAIGKEAPPAPKMPEGVPVANTAAESVPRAVVMPRRIFVPAVQSALPPSFRSVLDRVKLPSQIKRDPTAAQGKPGKKK